MEEKDILNRQEFLDYTEGKLNPERKAEIDRYLAEHPLEKIALQASMDYDEAEPLAPLLNRIDGQVDQKVSEVLKKTDKEVPIIKIWPLRKWRSIAASILVLAIAGFYFFGNEKPSNEVLFATHFDLYPNNLTEVQRGSTPANKPFDLGMQYYDNKKFDQAIQALTPYDTLSKVQFFIAVSELGRGNARSCLNTLAELEKDESMTEMQDGIIWYKALVLLKLNEKEKARVLLEKIANSDHYKRKAAAICLNHL